MGAGSIYRPPKELGFPPCNLFFRKRKDDKVLHVPDLKGGRPLLHFQKLALDKGEVSDGFQGDETVCRLVGEEDKGEGKEDKVWSAGRKGERSAGESMGKRKEKGGGSV
ncbi:hypothetical protein HAX54_046294 [Datura stramonium]|uniref:Uncharacterized protein n=1 Tax=Datura stramonium TaxID=4076 RepID=A0ABS8SR72_DATST|nr:hypothetical protein [Datura stramonium]